MHLRFAASQSSPKIAAEGLRVLSLLLNRTLTTPMEQTSDDGSTSSVPEMISNAAKAMILATRAGSHHTQEEPTSSPELRMFLQNIHRIIPTPLILLLKLIPTNKSSQVRIAGAVHLCESILVQTNKSWNADLDQVGGQDESNSVSELKTSALECLITMSIEENGE